MVCHSHHSLNHLLPPERIFTNLQARAGHPFQVYLSKLYCCIKVIYFESLIYMYNLLATDVLDFVCDCDFIINVAFLLYVRLSHE